MARIHIYRHYSFLSKDPVIEKMRTLVADEGLKWSDAAVISDLTPTTLKNWFQGDTRRPHFSSIAALSRSLGYDINFKKTKNSKIDVDAEKKAAADHKLAMAKKKAAPKRMREFEFA